MRAWGWLFGFLVVAVVGCSRPAVAPPPVGPLPSPSPSDSDLVLAESAAAAAESLANDALDHVREQRWDEALAAGWKALELKPDQYSAMYPVAWALLHTDQWQEAGPYLEKAQPGFGTYHARGLWHERSGNTLEAFVQYAKAGPEAKGDLDRLTAEWVVMLPQAPFWGPPGTVILGRSDRGDEIVLSQSLEPVPFGDRTLQPVQLEYVTYLAHAVEQKLWLDGTLYMMIGTLNIQEAPTALADLPYTPGAVWGFWSEGRGFRVIGFEALQTPAGTFPTVVVEDPESRVRQWWSPGTGLMKVQGLDRTLVAVRVEHGKPQRLADVKQITPEVTAIIANQKIYDQHGRILADFLHDKNEGRRPSESWADIGDHYPAVVRGTHSQGEPNWKQTTWAYDPGTGTFQPVPWHFPDGSVRTELVGFVYGDKPGEVRFLDEEYYPQGDYTFQYSDGAYRVTESRMHYADTEERLAIMLTRPLNRESFLRLFADPALGERVYAAVYKHGRNGLSGGWWKAESDGSWVVEAYGGMVLAHFSVAPHGNEFRITEFAVDGGLP